MLKNQIGEQQKVVDDSKPDEGQLAEKEAVMETLLREYEAAKENSRELKEEVKKLNKKIKDVQSSKVSPPLEIIQADHLSVGVCRTPSETC
jgi:hypothetical protein